MSKDTQRNSKSDGEPMPKTSCQIEGGPITSSSRTMGGDDYADGYPDRMNKDMHINQGRGGAKLRGK